MKYIKKFERMKILDPQVGDYVIMRTKKESLENFISNNIGKIVSVDFRTIIVEYENVPKDLASEFRYNERKFLNELIKFISKDKEELELKISSQKYNL